MLCKPVSSSPIGTIAGYDPETLRKIRDRIRVVFGRDCAGDDAFLAHRYSLTETGELVMIL